MPAWLIPTIVALLVGLLSLWYMKRRDTVSADRGVLDQIVTHLAAYRRFLDSAVSTGTAPHPDVRAFASTLSSAWTSLEDGANEVGKLSRLRYDGLRPLGRRIAEACTSTATARERLEPIARGVAMTSVQTLEDTIPWPMLNTDTLVYGTLAIVYRREGPLTPRRRAWWRRRSRRDSTPMQVSAPIRPRTRKRKDDTDRVTSIDQVREMIRDNAELGHLSTSEINDLAYRILHVEEPPEGG